MVNCDSLEDEITLHHRKEEIADVKFSPGKLLNSKPCFQCVLVLIHCNCLPVKNSILLLYVYDFHKANANLRLRCDKKYN